LAKKPIEQANPAEVTAGLRCRRRYQPAHAAHLPD